MENSQKVILNCRLRKNNEVKNMRLSRFMLLIVLGTVFSLLYVYQQTEIFRLAYDGQKKVSVVEELLDKNTILRYNISQNSSLIRIGIKVSSSADFQMPDTYRLVKLARPVAGFKVNQYNIKKETVVSRLFGIKRQAEAKTIAPAASFSSTPRGYFNLRQGQVDR